MRHCCVDNVHNVTTLLLLDLLLDLRHSDAEPSGRMIYNVHKFLTSQPN